MGDRSALKQDTSRDYRERETEHLRALTFTWAGQIQRPHSQLSDTSTLRNITPQDISQDCQYTSKHTHRNMHTEIYLTLAQTCNTPKHSNPLETMQLGGENFFFCLFYCREGIPFLPYQFPLQTVLQPNLIPAITFFACV